MICAAENTGRTISACLYPPQGQRGFGPRRAANYDLIDEAEFCRVANDVVGPADLAASLDYAGRRNHPDVQQVIEQIVVGARRDSVYVGVASGPDPARLKRYIEMGAHWLAVGNDTVLLLGAADQAVAPLREHHYSDEVQASA